MRLHGRVIVYGEYLMRAASRGLIMPSHLSLATADEPDQPSHPEYSLPQDSVAQALSLRGLQTEQRIRGTMPFGWGLAASTVLAFLHARNQLATTDLLQLIHETDRSIHGFIPSGVDTASVLHQSTGFYSARGWEPVPLSPLRYTLLLFPKEGSRTLPEIKQQITAEPSRLTAIADRLSAGVSSTGEVDYGGLFEYARALLECRLYSPVVETFVRDMLSRGIATKATGGLYDKAVMVV